VGRENVNPLGFKHLSGGPHPASLPAEHGNAVTRGNELPRLENLDLLDLGNAREPFGDGFLRSKCPCLGQALRATELPFDVVSDEVEYRGNVPPTECGVDGLDDLKCLGELRSLNDCIGGTVHVDGEIRKSDCSRFAFPRTIAN
jgi:hypothetical protein